MWNTAAEFKERKTRPGRKPDYVSRNKRTGEVSSEYWYTKDGVIRGSNHWGPEVGSCDWALDGITGAKGRDVFNPGSELYVGSSKRYGKAKWSDFTQKTENIVVGGKVIGTTNFENTTGKETVKVGEKEYVRFQRNDWMDSKLMKKSIEYIEEVEKFNPYHGPDGRFTTASGATSFTIRTRAGYNQGMADRSIQRAKEQHNKKIPKMTEDEYLGRKGVGSPISDFMDDKLRIPHGLTQRQWNQLQRDAEKARTEYAKQRQAAKEEYRQKVKNGEIRPKSRIETLIETAHGNDDKESVRAARRVLDKRGIDWRSAKVDKSIETIEEVKKFNPYHDRLGRFSTAGSAASFTIRTKDPGKQHWADRAIAREKDGWEASKPKEIEFTPAKNKKEAVKYAQEKLGFSKVSYGTKMDIDTINHINKTITSVQAKYPEVKGAVQELKTTSSRGVYAQVRTKSDGSMNLEMGTKLYGAGLDSLKKSYDHCIEVGYHPKGTEYDSIIWHEYGHVLASISTKSNYGLSSREQFAADDSKNRLGFAYSRRANKVEQGWLREASDSLKENTVSVSLSISKYAAKNAAEAFAEAFAEVTCSKNPREEALAVVKASGWYRE